MEQQQAGNDDDLTRLLPEDVLAQVLSRLAPRDLAASRCVCTEWKDAIDGRRLLRTDLLPLSVGGIFLNFSAPARMYAEFFRPSGTLVSGSLTHVPSPHGALVLDHCNGLLLVLPDCVANPATGWWAPLPPCPDKGNCLHQGTHIVFNPAVSPHYSVFVISYAPLYGELKGDPTMEWPPSSYPLHVFSSRTGRWEERPFLRQGEAVGAIADVRLGEVQSYKKYRCFAAYWKQVLYVHCHNDFIFRISLSKDKYRVIKPPPATSVRSILLGKSEKGPYLAEKLYPDLCFKVWILDESNDKSSEWVLTHCNKHLGMMLPRCYLDNKVCGPWILEDINYKEFRQCDDDDDDDDAMGTCVLEGETVAASIKQQYDCSYSFEYNFTLDSTTKDTTSDGSSCYIDDLWVIGFHPYKEIVFLGSGFKIVVAYDLNSSRFQYLGNIHPTEFDFYRVNEVEGFDETFVYMPCKLEAYMAIQVPPSRS